MKNLLYIVLLILIFYGCSDKPFKGRTTSYVKENDDRKYEYYLMEALRQKYVGLLSESAKIFEKCIELDKNRAVAYYELAQIYANNGIPQKALKYARTAAEIDAGNYWYQISAASFYMQYSGRDSAIIYFKRALKNNPESIEVKRVIAGLYSEFEEREKADSLFLILDEAGALDDQMFIIMISSLMEMKQTEEAAKRTISIIERNPSDMRYRVLLAEIYNDGGMTEKSDSIYQSIIGSNPDGIEEKMLMMGNLVKRKDYYEINRLLSDIVNNDDIIKERKVNIIRDLFNDSVYINSDACEIEKNLIVLESKFRDDGEILALRPFLYESQKRNEDAIKRYEEIIKVEAANYYFKERLLILYAEENRYENLYSLSSAYATENNKSLLGKFYYAISAMELGKYDIAERELNKALILAGNDDQLRFQVLSFLSDLKYRAGNFDMAFKFLDEALTINPDDVQVLNNYAYYLAESNKDLMKALKMAEKVMATNGDNSTYVDTYAWVLYKLGRYEEAYEKMKMIFSEDDESDPELLEHMGFILKELSKCDEAVGFWRRAIKMDSLKIHLTKEIEKCSNER